jgi:hypothetical protein
MKALKHILAAILALSLFTSCGILGGGTSTNTGTTTTASTGNSTGINTGSALASIFSILQSTGIIDLGNLTNLINLGQILLGANSLTNATQAYTDQFAADLIKGSNNKVNKSNVSSVIAGLKNLASTDTSILQKSTQAAYTGSLVPVATSNKDVKANMDAVNAILAAMK